MRFLFLFVVFNVVSCDFFSTSQEEYRHSRDDSDSSLIISRKSKNKKVAFTPKGTNAKQTEAELEEQKRIRALTLELAAVELSIVTHSVRTVADDAKMLLALQKAARIIDEIYKLQVHSNNLIWQKQLESSGEKVELEIFRRYAGPWCRVLASNQCNAIATKPPNKTGGVFWPLGMTHLEFEQISKVINSRELLSPFGLVVRDGDTRLKAISYADDVRFSSMFADLSNAFSEAASLGNRKQKSLLLQFVQMVQESNIFTMGLNEKSLDAMVGDWRVYFGGFDTNLDPYGVKRSFELIVARPYLPIAEVLAWYRANRADIVGAYWQLFEELSAPSIEESESSSIEVVDVWIAAGRARYVPDSAIRILQLPTGASSSAVPPKVVISINGFSKQLDLLNLYLRQIFPTQVVGLDAVLANHVAKELISVVVPGSSSLVTNKEGKKISVKRLLGKEIKSISKVLNWMGATWLLQYEKAHDQVTDESVRDRIAAMLAVLLRSAVSQEETEQTAARWVLQKMILGNALIYDAATKTFKINDSFLAVASTHFVSLNETILGADFKGAQVIVQEITALKDAEHTSGDGVETALNVVIKNLLGVENRKKVIFQYEIWPE